MGVKVTVELLGLETVIANLDKIGEQAPSNLEKQAEALAKDSLDAWQGATPVRSGRLKGGSSADVGGLSITFTNGIKYYPFRDLGHMTPMGWHTAHGYRPAKRRSHVGGAFMTEKLVDFVSENIEEYLSKFLD